MSENKITREEMIGWFGSAAPIEAINLIWNSDGTKTLGEIRAELRAMGERQKASADSMVNKVAAALAELPIRDNDNKGGELDQLRLREAARAAINAMRELPEEPGPRYTAGEYSRKNHAAMIDDALA